MFFKKTSKSSLNFSDEIFFRKRKKQLFAIIGTIILKLCEKSVKIQNYMQNKMQNYILMQNF